MATKTQRAVAAARERLKKDSTQGRILRMATAFGLGLARQHRLLDSVPEVMGSKLATVSLVAGGVGLLAKGKFGSRALDVAEASAGIALYQLGEGGVANIMGAPSRRERHAITAGAAEDLIEGLRDMAAEVR